MPCCCGQPALLHQRPVAIPRDLGKLPVRLSLLQRRLELTERRLRLCDLMIELRCYDFGQQLPCLHVVADIDLALVDVAAGARKHIGGRECRGRGRQT